MLIQHFPNFSLLHPLLKKDFDRLTCDYEPYSDFVFSSLYAWDVNSTTEVSNLHGNLVIKFPHYVTSEDTYTFIGTHNVDLCLSELLSILSHNDSERSLHLIPEITISNINDRSKFVISEDRDNFDYVYKTEMLATLPGKSFARKRSTLNHFYNANAKNFFVTHIDFTNTNHIESIRDINHRWQTQRQKTDEDIRNEYTAINRILDSAPELEVDGLFFTLHNEVVAYTMFEIKDESFCIGHFEKADPSQRELYTVMRHEMGTYLSSRKIIYLNAEQDLGIEGLRTAKMHYHPDRFLKKYIVKSST